MDDETSVRWALGMLGGILALVAIGLSLGYSVSTDEDVTTVGYSLVAKLTWIAGGVGAMFFGWKLRKRREELGYGILCIMPMVLFFALPRVFIDQVRVDNQGVTERRWGFFWYSAKAVEFRQYNNVIYRVSPGSRGREDHNLIFRRGDDVTSQRVLGVSDMLKKAWPAIAENAEKRGMAVTMNVR